MAINPDDITTVRVDQLTPEVITLTSILPHQVGTDLKQGNVQDLVNLVATAIGAGSGVGFLPISVTNGQQLPDVPADPSFFLCGPGTYLNINGYADVICTGELNAVMSLSDHWEVAVEIPIIAEIGVQTVTGSAVDNTNPLNPIIDLRTDVLQGYYVNSTQFDDLNFTPFIPNSAKIYVNNAAPFGIYIWNGSTYIIVAETNGGGGGSQTLAQTLVLGNATEGNNIELTTDDAILIDNGSRLKKGTSDAGYGGANGIALKCSLDYEFKFEAGRLYVMEQDGFTIRELSHNFEITPTVNDDNTKGFVVGSRWMLDSGIIYRCNDDTEGAAVWVAVGTQTLQQTMELGRTYVETLGDYTYEFSFNTGVLNLIVKDNTTNITSIHSITGTNQGLTVQGATSFATLGLSLEVEPFLCTQNVFGFNFLKIPYRTSGSGDFADFLIPNNKPTGIYTLATLDDIPSAITIDAIPTDGSANAVSSNGVFDALQNTNTNAIDRITVKLSQSINKGQAVYISSANGTNIIVSKASNSSEATSSKTLGLLETTGVTNDIVNVVTSGLLSGLNTSTATIGDAVWLGVNGGLLYGLANKPYAPAHLVYIGVVSRVSATVGEIIVKVQNGFELKEIHDVDLISNAPTNNQGLIYESATSLWKNKTIDKTLIGLANVDNTSDANKPVSSAQSTAINAKVSDTITDGVTTIAPSQNAVFDALNTLRLPIASVGNTTLTGTITETKVATLLASANTFDSACFVYLTYNFMKSVGTAITIKLYVNTSDSLTGATLLGQYLTGSNRNVDFTRKFILRGTTLDLLTDTASRITNINNDTVFGASTTVTVAPTSALYFIFSVTLDLVGSVVTNKVAILEKQKL